MLLVISIAKQLTKGGEASYRHKILAPMVAELSPHPTGITQGNSPSMTQVIILAFQKMMFLTCQQDNTTDLSLKLLILFRTMKLQEIVKCSIFYNLMVLVDMALCALQRKLVKP